jgi:hypothetical protein
MIQLQIVNSLNEMAKIADRALLLTVFLPLIIWLILMLIYLWLLSKRYPLGNYNSPGQGENPYKTETMGLPRGIIRGMLSLTILIGAVLFQIYALRFLESADKIASFMTAFEIVLGFYFGSKVVHHLASVDKNKVKAVAKAKSDSNDEFYDAEASG